MSDAAADPLKLIALDADDLAIVSAHLQDAVLKAADIVYLPREQRFALALRRFDWEGAQHGQRRRRLTALHFDRVQAVRSARCDSGGSTPRPGCGLSLALWNMPRISVAALIGAFSRRASAGSATAIESEAAGADWVCAEAGFLDQSRT